MAANCQFAFAVHVLAVLALKRGEDVTSSALAASISTNPVVIRRLLATLERAGLLLSRKDAGSGSRLRRAPERITLEEVFRATTPANSLSLHPQNPDERCQVGQNIEGVLGEIIGTAWASFATALAGYTLADVLRELSQRSVPALDLPVSATKASLAPVAPR